MNLYLVALSTGGLMEDPIVRFSEFQTIPATNREEASELYNKKNKCSFFYGSCMAGFENGKLTVYNKNLTFQQAADFETQCKKAI